MSGNSPSTGAAAGRRTSDPTAAAVRAFLRANPDFLLKHPDLLEVLTPPPRHSGGNVTDLGGFMVGRLQGEVERLREREASLLETARTNQAVQGRVHRATLSMLDAMSFEHLIHIVTRDLSDVLDVDAITLCVEASNGDEPKRVPTGGVFVLEAGAIDHFIEPGQSIYLGPSFPGHDAVFGPAAGIVHSMALVRLAASPHSPVGLLALGSRDAKAFEAGQGKDLLIYLARFLERLLRAWLDLPS